MAKRFHDTEIWREDWFIEIPKDYRFFWLYVKDKCDHAGIWKPNITTFNKLFDCQVKKTRALELFNNGKQRIVVLDNGRWFIPDFIPFQYGGHLNSNNRMHLSILRLLELNKIKLTSIRGLIDLKDTPMIMGVKDKDKDKDKKKDGVEGNKERWVPMPQDCKEALVMIGVDIKHAHKEH